ncbi:MAG: indolepyruvate ferredoxin oxidoreductase family protein [Pseudomonadota bacterium]
MMLRDVSLNDRYDLDKSPVLLSGTQALARATLMQRARDMAAGHDTAGYVTGYRGSPLGAVEGAFGQARKLLEPARIRFQPGLNEDLAATALWGAQQAELRGEGRQAGVFGLWYGKGPGVDRTGDVFRHANLAGTSPLGGVLAAMGDDHTCESSTTCHQSELAMMDAMMPILSPSGVQELLDCMITGWALSRYAGLWVGIKAMKDTVEATAVVDGDAHRLAFALPDDFEMPEGGLNIRLHDTPQLQEARLHDYKRYAAQAFARANGLDGRRLGKPGARLGIVSAGKSWLDLESALATLGIGPAEAEALGITTYKVGMVWPVEPRGLKAWAEGLDTILVVEEKRALIETQAKEILYNIAGQTRMIGKQDLEGRPLLPAKMDLDPPRIAHAIGHAMALEGIEHAPAAEGLARLSSLAEGSNTPAIAERQPWFCAGCPHSSSTRIPEGARAYAGIGCHYMVQWMDRETEGFTHMGGEGANWIGEAPFSTRGHVFQNIGDGTYNHSGLMAIRAAVASGVTITYKVLYNDAVAMTGGQTHEGGLTPRQIAAELLAAGVRRVDCVYDEKEGVPEMPSGVKTHTRDKLLVVEREFQEIEGTTAIVYVQTCAAEKRRRRKRGTFPDPDRRVFINPSVCEGCGDCGKQSNCVAILPLETPLGRKREIDQSACNKDFSCLKGFCPSFVTVEGAKLRGGEGASFEVPPLPDPVLPAMDGPYNLLITGIGGTGVVTVGALLSMAAHLEGKGASEMQMAGLAQKGGAVAIHCRLAPTPSDIHAVRIATGEADALIGGDMVVAASPKALALMARGRTRAVLSSEEVVTGAFTRDTEFHLPAKRLRLAVEARIGTEELRMIDAQPMAERLLGNTIYANVLLLGAAWQAGLVPLTEAALRRAIELNGAGVEGNLRAFALGRWAVAEPAAVAALLDAPAREESFEEKVARRAGHLTGYQNARLARRYRARVEAAMVAERAAGVEGFAQAVAEGYFKLLCYKDEYEVARLHHETLEKALADTFASHGRVTFHLAPPILGRTDADGRPRKTAFGPWMARVFAVLRHGKLLRGTPLDPFGYTAERRMERQLIRDYEAMLEEVQPALTPASAEIATELARLPLEIRGFGHVKEANAERAAHRREQLLEALRSGPAPVAEAAE